MKKQRACSLDQDSAQVFADSLSYRILMTQKLKNLFILYKIIKTRGNQKLIRHSRKQLIDFILCKNDLNQKSFVQAMFYWFNMLKGLNVLVWRLETFGFLYSPILSEEDKKRLNQYL